MGGIFGGGGGKSVAPQPAATTPVEPEPERMPTPLDPLILAAKQRTFEEARKRTGRESTILTDTLRYRTD